MSALRPYQQKALAAVAKDGLRPYQLDMIAALTAEPGWTPAPYTSRIYGMTFDRFDKGKWRVEENRRTSSMGRPFYVQERTASGHYVTVRGQGFGRYETATAAMSAVDRKERA